MMALEIARRAIPSNASPSSQDSRDILSFLSPFENSQVASLLHAAVDTAPKLLKILNRRNNRASHNQPYQQTAEWFKDRVFCRQDRGTDGDNL